MESTRASVQNDAVAFEAVLREFAGRTEPLLLEETRAQTKILVSCFFGSTNPLVTTARSQFAPRYGRTQALSFQTMRLSGR